MGGIEVETKQTKTFSFQAKKQNQLEAFRNQETKNMITNKHKDKQ